MDVLLSIKPEFAEKILEQEKRYEFRKTCFRNPSAVDKIYMYASSPVQEVVGSFSPDGIVEDSPSDLWSDFGSESGIARRSRFMDYFENSETGYAIGIKDVYRFSTPIDPQRQIVDFRPPVSFQYLPEEHDLSRPDRDCRTGSD